MSTYHGILLHVIFATKFHKPYRADEWREDLFAYIGGTVKEHEASLLKAGGVKDHVHLLLKVHPKYAILNPVVSVWRQSSVGLSNGCC